MSIIGVEITEDKIRIAYDSQSTVDNEKITFSTEPKAFIVDNIAVGLAAESVVKQYLREFLSNQKTPVKLPTTYAVCKLMEEFLAFARQGNHRFEEKDLGELVITDGVKAYSFVFEWFTCRNIKEYEFIGSPRKYAEGAYLGMKEICKNSKVATPDILVTALSLTCKLDVYCSEPVKLLEIAKSI